MADIICFFKLKD